jgi:hypothetical protein
MRVHVIDTSNHQPEQDLGELGRSPALRRELDTAERAGRFEGAWASR